MPLFPFPGPACGAPPFPNAFGAVESLLTAFSNPDIWKKPRYGNATASSGADGLSALAGPARCGPPKPFSGNRFMARCAGVLPGGLPIMLPAGNMRPRDANTFIREGHPMPDSYSRRHFLKLSAALLAGGAAIAAAPDARGMGFSESRTSAP